MKCPCCSELLYEECCKPYHDGDKLPATAELLMRSRYSAFAIPNGDYLLETTLPSKRKYHNKEDFQDWRRKNTWQKLEIIAKPDESHVEFIAYYSDEKGEAQIHHELSKFKKIQNRWFYVYGDFLD